MNSDATPEELASLKEVQNSQLLGRGGKPITGEMKARLIELGLIEEKLGGLVLTPKGREVLSH